MNSKVKELINALDSNTEKCIKCKKYFTKEFFTKEFTFRSKHNFRIYEGNYYVCNKCWGSLDWSRDIN